MTRYFKLYGYFLRFSFSKALEFRVDFYFRFLMDVAYYVMNLAFFKIIFLHSTALAGWSEAQVTIFVGTFIVVDAINMTVFTNNSWNLATLVNKGDLDYYLVRPVSTFFFVSLRDFAANSFLNLIMAVSILVWAMTRYPEPMGVVQISLFTVLVLNGSFLYFLVLMLFILPVFWTQSSRGLQPLFWTASKFMERPHLIFTSLIRIVLLTVMPFSLMASVPASVLFSPNPWLITGGTLTVTAAFFAFVLFIWRLGLRNYSSASS